MKGKISPQKEYEDWITYLVHRDKEIHKNLEHITQEIEEINKKLHILGRSVLKLYKSP